MDTLHRVIGLCDALNERVGRLTAWGTLAMVVVTFAIVVLRYLFNLGWIAMQELVTYLHAMIFMLGAAYTLKHDGHVRVDIFYQKASARRAVPGSICLAPCCFCCPSVCSCSG